MAIAEGKVHYLIMVRSFPRSFIEMLDSQAFFCQEYKIQSTLPQIWLLIMKCFINN